jgi:hypothetical protein
MRIKTITKIENGKLVERTPDGKIVGEANPERRKRESRLREILQSQRAPGAVTTDNYTRGRGTLEQQFPGEVGQRQLNYLVKQAQRQGYNPKHTDIYESTLAKFPGDPAAFVSSGSDALAHVRTVCEERNTSCRGAYNRQRNIPEQKKQKPFLSKSLLTKYTREELAANPSLARKSKREIKEAVVAKYAYKGE